MREHVPMPAAPQPAGARQIHASVAWRLAVAAAIAFGWASACERTPPAEPLAPDESGSTEARAAAPRIVCLGDSLTAGLGLAPAEAYPALLQQRLDAAGYRYEVVNAGVSGDTSAGGRRRLNWALGGDVRVLIVALGANDGLRGLPVASMRENLSAIIEEARTRHVEVLLVGMEAPPNFGAAYTREFRAAYADLAKSSRVSFVPFLLDGVAGVKALNQGDGVHPTAEGQRVMADLLWPELERLVRQAERR